MKIAAFWHHEKDGVRCDLCPHHCFIKEGGDGFCGVRGVRDTELYALTYGKIAASAYDPIEKKPLYHFYPGHKTFSVGGIGCNLRCRHCQNWQISCRDATDNLDGLYPLLPIEAIRLAQENFCESIVWTYNEPSIWYEYILDSAPLAQEAGLKTVMVTAGMINSEPLQNLLPYIDAYRLDIKGFSGDFYRWLTGIDCLDQVLENGLAAFSAGCHVEIVTNLIPGHNDDEMQLRALARWIVQNLSSKTPWHLTAYFPNHHLQVEPTGISALERGVEIGHEEGLSHIYIGNIAGHKSQHSYCEGCNVRLITRDGFRIVQNRMVHFCCPECGVRFENYRGYS
jgi:pyruvate formate lyase activating enzyme